MVNKMKTIYQVEVFKNKMYIKPKRIIFTLLLWIFIVNVTTVYHELGHSFIGAIWVGFPDKFVLLSDYMGPFSYGYVQWDNVDVFPLYGRILTTAAGGVFGTIVGAGLIYCFREHLGAYMRIFVFVPVINNFIHIFIEPMGSMGMRMLTFSEMFLTINICVYPATVILWLILENRKKYTCGICYTEMSKGTRRMLCDDCIEYYNISTK